MKTDKHYFYTAGMYYGSYEGKKLHMVATTKEAYYLDKCLYSDEEFHTYIEEIFTLLLSHGFNQVAIVQENVTRGTIEPEGVFR